MEIMERERDNLALVLLDVMMPDIDGYEVLEYMNFNGLLNIRPSLWSRRRIRPRTRRNACGWARWILCANRMLRMLSNAGSKTSSNCTITRMGLKKCSSKRGSAFNVNEIIVAVLTSVLETKNGGDKGAYPAYQDVYPRAA